MKNDKNCLRYPSLPHFWWSKRSLLLWENTSFDGGTNVILFGEHFSTLQFLAEIARLWFILQYGSQGSVDFWIYRHEPAAIVCFGWRHVTWSFISWPQFFLVGGAISSPLWGWNPQILVNAIIFMSSANGAVMVIEEQKSQEFQKVSQL